MEQETVRLMYKLFLIIGAASAAIAVMIGAFGAHALKARLTPELLAVFETGARYHLVHALAVIAVGLLMTRNGHLALTAAGWLLIAGTVVFSGSLYVLALSGVRWLGAITPFGGAAMIAGWFAFAWGAYFGR